MEAETSEPRHHAGDAGDRAASVAERCREILEYAGHAPVVAHVDGDDVHGNLDELGALEHLDDAGHCTRVP